MNSSGKAAPIVVICVFCLVALVLLLQSCEKKSNFETCSVALAAEQNKSAACLQQYTSCQIDNGRLVQANNDLTSALNFSDADRQAWQHEALTCSENVARLVKGLKGGGWTAILAEIVFGVAFTFLGKGLQDYERIRAVIWIFAALTGIIFAIFLLFI